MIATEFLLYLATVTIAVYFIMSVSQNNNEPEIQYRYIPVKSNDTKSDNKCSNQQCVMMGRCICNNIINTGECLSP